MKSFCESEEFIVHEAGFIDKETPKFLMLVSKYVPAGEYVAGGYSNAIP